MHAHTQQHKGLQWCQPTDSLNKNTHIQTMLITRVFEVSSSFKYLKVAIFAATNIGDFEKSLLVLAKIS